MTRALLPFVICPYRILAHVYLWAGQDFYEGVISAIHYEDGTVDIQYNDGDQEFHVHPSFVAINTQVSDNQDQTNLTSADMLPWQVGDRVQAVFAAHKGGTVKLVFILMLVVWRIYLALPSRDANSTRHTSIATGETLYPGTIAAANADGTFNVAYDDGDIGLDVIWFCRLACVVYHNSLTNMDYTLASQPRGSSIPWPCLYLLHPSNDQIAHKSGPSQLYLSVIHSLALSESYRSTFISMPEAITPSLHGTKHNLSVYT